MRSAAGCPVKGGGVIWATDHWRTVLDLKGRLRCRGRGAKGRGLPTCSWARQSPRSPKALPGFTPLPTILAIIKLSTIEPLDLCLGPIGVAKTSLLPAMADGTARAGVFRSTDRRRRTTVGSGLRYPGPLLSGSGVAMPTDPGPFRVGNPGRHGGCGFVRVRPQLRLVLPGRRIKRVRRHRVGAGSRAQCRALPCRRRGRRIGPPGFDFDAVVPSAGIDRHFFVRTSKVPRLGSGVLMPSFGRSEGTPGALADRGPEFRDASCCASSSNACFPSVRRGISRSPFPGKTSQDTRGGWRPEAAPVLVIET
jgi:hypothetical protein